MYDQLPKRVMRRNAARITELAQMFGHLSANDHGQKINDLLNLSIPCAYLINQGLVTGVVDSFDTVNDQAVADVERYCREAVRLLEAEHGTGWWSDTAANMLPTTTTAP